MHVATSHGWMRTKLGQRPACLWPQVFYAPGADATKPTTPLLRSTSFDLQTYLGGATWAYVGECSCRAS